MNHNQISIWTKEEIIEDQKSWPDIDEYHGKDFSWYEYWIVAHGTGDTEGFDTVEELNAFIDEYGLRQAS